MPRRPACGSVTIEAVNVVWPAHAGSTRRAGDLCETRGFASVARVTRRIGKRDHAEHLQQRLRAREGLGRGAARPPARAGSPGRRSLIAALAAVAAAAASLAVASGQDRNDLVPPSIAVGRDGLATVAWTEVARPGIRVAQQSAPDRWSRPVLLSSTGGPGSVASAATASPTSPSPARRGWSSPIRPAGRAGANRRPSATGRRPPRRGPSGDSRRRGRGDLAIAYQTRGRPASARPSRSIRGVAYGVARRLGRAAQPGGEPQAGSCSRGFARGRGARPRSTPAGALGLPRGRVCARPTRSAASGWQLAGGETLVPYIEERQQVVMTADPDQPDSPAAVSAIIAGVGNSTAAAGTPTGRAVVLSRNPRYHVLSLALLQGTARLGDLTVDQGQRATWRSRGTAEQAFVAYWDYPDGRQLHVAPGAAGSCARRCRPRSAADHADPDRRRGSPTSPSPEHPAPRRQGGDLARRPGAAC